MLDFTVIGITNSSYPHKFGTPRQPGLVPEANAFLEIYPEFQPSLSLEGLNQYSHLWVIYLFHAAKRARFRAKIHPPRLGGKTQGCFATRTPHRPNPIGLSLVKIEKIESSGIWVRGVDFISGTPILDIKPYLPTIEAKPQAQSQEFDAGINPAIDVTWSAGALAKLEEIELDSANRELRKIVESTLRLDPRPLVYRGYEDRESKYRSSHIVMIRNFDITFHFESLQSVCVDEIKVLDMSSTPTGKEVAWSKDISKII